LRSSNLVTLFDNTGSGYTSESSGLGTARQNTAGATYGGDKAIFGYGYDSLNQVIKLAVHTFFNNKGGYAGENTTAVGAARIASSAASYGGDKALFYGGTFGKPGTFTYLSNVTLISNTGAYVSESDVAATPYSYASSASYGEDKALFAYGANKVTPGGENTVLRFSNNGTLISQTNNIGLSRPGAAGSKYGNGRAMMAFGNNILAYYSSVTLFDNNANVISESDTAATKRTYVIGASYGGDKALIGFGLTIGTYVNARTRFSNTGTFIDEKSDVGTARYGGSGASFGSG
jgi:hypothetical protein